MRIYKDKTPSQLIRQILSILAHQTRKLVGRLLDLRYLFADSLYPTVTVPIGDGKSLRYHAQSRTVLLRARSTLSKELMTIRWIEGFEPGLVFWDVGANIGTYSLFAARRRDATVLSFEPYPPNYLNLVRNLEINGLSENISAFCLAFTDETRIDGFYIHPQQLEAGSSGSAFGTPTDQRGKTFEFLTKVSMLGFSIDSFVEIFGAPVPNYLKIDVDGIEILILKGAHNTLRDPHLRSVIVELEGSRPEMVAEAIALMEDAGFAVDSSQRATDNPANLSTNYLFVCG